MGGCVSCRSVHLPTARLVVLEEDAGGFIKEFPEPVKVAEILREKPGFFVCDADLMRYDEYVSPLSAEQELQVEHLYFLLPVTKLSHPLPASDMAALAVETSAAMERSRHSHNKLGQCCCKIRARSVHYKLQRVASSGRKRINGAPLRRNLSTIHEETFT